MDVILAEVACKAELVVSRQNRRFWPRTVTWRTATPLPAEVAEQSSTGSETVDRRLTNCGCWSDGESTMRRSRDCRGNENRWSGPTKPRPQTARRLLFAAAERQSVKFRMPAVRFWPWRVR